MSEWEVEFDEEKARRAGPRRAGDGQKSKRLDFDPFLVVGKEEKRSKAREVREGVDVSSAMGISTRKRGWEFLLSLSLGRGLLRGF